ncbi:unnamed protein product [Lepidochelys olivacea]
MKTYSVWLLTHTASLAGSGGSCSSRQGRPPEGSETVDRDNTQSLHITGSKSPCLRVSYNLLQVSAEVCSPRLRLQPTRPSCPSSFGSAAGLEIFETLQMIKCVFLSLALAPCALSQLQLVASGPGLGKVSEPLTLTCAVSGVSINTQCHVWYWVRQFPGEELESMGYVYPYIRVTRYTPSLQDLITISTDTTSNQVSLQLHSLTAADTATYYCARRDTVTWKQGAWDKKGASHTPRLPERRHLTLPLRSTPFRCPWKETLCQRHPRSWREAEKEETPALVTGQKRNFVTGVLQFWKPPIRT